MGSLLFSREINILWQEPAVFVKMKRTRLETVKNYGTITA